MNRNRLLLSTVLLLASRRRRRAGAVRRRRTGLPRQRARPRLRRRAVLEHGLGDRSSTNRNLGVIRLGDPQPMNLSPLYKGQVLVHGLGFSPDRKTLAVVSIASNSVTFIDTATNRVKHTTYVGRSPHEASSPRTAARSG